MNKLLIAPVVFLSMACLAQKKESKAVVPQEKGGIYILTIENLEMEIIPAIGGRISSLKLNGKNFLTGKDINPNFWGSTFWPSPQKAWEGPASADLDNKPYTVSVENNIIKMQSKPESKTGLLFTKEIWGNATNHSFVINYTITNQSNQVQKVAPWEVTRVYPGGLAFYPKGKGERWGNIANLAEDKEGITWFAYQKDKIPNKHNKFFSDGSEGWVAQVNDDIIFVKKFPDIPAEKAAPSEAEVEVYTNPDKTYVEIEQQGAYQELQPAASLTWEVTWFLRKLPTTLKVKAGNSELVTYVRKIIK